MEVIPVASDSLGVRSLATYVETSDVKIFIDPSAALGPSRYGFPPHPSEIKALEKTKKTIAKKSATCDILVISHYHYDHYDPLETFYDDKTIYLKNPTRNINKSQQKRGKEFIEHIKDSSSIIKSDNSHTTIGGTTLIFSPPFFHGPPNIPLGYVIMTTIDDGSVKLLHSSDVQGPVAEDATQYIINHQIYLSWMVPLPFFWDGNSVKKILMPHKTTSLGLSKKPSVTSSWITIFSGISNTGKDSLFPISRWKIKYKHLLNHWEKKIICWRHSEKNCGNSRKIDSVYTVMFYINSHG